MRLASSKGWQDQMYGTPPSLQKRKNDQKRDVVHIQKVQRKRCIKKQNWSCIPKFASQN
jgi:hypothetical protein